MEEPVNNTITGRVVPQTCRYKLRLAETEKDVRLAQVFRAGQFDCGTPDIDSFDAHCRHVLIESPDTGEIQACFRFLHFANSACIDKSYSAQFYDLSRLQGFGRPLLEIGRFCVREGGRDFAVHRMAWAFLTRYVDAHGIALMFGCSSFVNTDAVEYTPAFALLKQRHLAPPNWMPGIKSPEVFKFADRLRDANPDMKAANRTMPPLLRTYLGMGGWVSDHAVVDHAMNTLHVFTGVEVDAIPAPRVRLLRKDAGLLGA